MQSDAPPFVENVTIVLFPYVPNHRKQNN